MKTPSRNSRKGKTDPELRACLRRLLDESEDLRERFSELWASLPSTPEAGAGESLPPQGLGVRVRATLEEVLHYRLDPMIESLVGITADAGRQGSRA